MQPSKDQIGYKDENGKRVEPTRCAVSERECQGKPHITHYGPDDKFVYVLAEYDHLWPEAAPFYGFPVEEEASDSGSGGFDLRKLKKAQAKAKPSDAPVGQSFTGGLGSLSPIPTMANTGKRPKPPTIPTDAAKIEGDA